MESNTAAMEQVEQELQDLSARHKAAAAKAEAVEAEIASLEEELANVGGVRVKAQRAKVRMGELRKRRGSGLGGRQSWVGL